jgi:hypothetical protein
MGTTNARSCHCAFLIHFSFLRCGMTDVIDNWTAYSSNRVHTSPKVVAGPTRLKTNIRDDDADVCAFSTDGRGLAAQLASMGLCRKTEGRGCWMLSHGLPMLIAIHHCTAGRGTECGYACPAKGVGREKDGTSFFFDWSADRLCPDRTRAAVTVDRDPHLL